MFDAWACDAHGIAFLKSIFTDRMRGHLTADDHHWNRIHISRGDARDGIGNTRATGD